MNLSNIDALPQFSREQLEIHSSGKISSMFGPQFEAQDSHSRQVRLPIPPLLLVDRVNRIDAFPGSMGTGSVFSEVDVRDDSWYLHEGRMPFGMLFEAGQAILVLLSWLGVDLANPDERVFRFLGGEVSLHGPLPQPGEQLSFAAHVDGYAKQGGIQLVFFHSECRREGKLLLNVRHGQAGLFSYDELANARGIQWDPTVAEQKSETALPPPLVPIKNPRRFSADQVRAFVEGRLYDCFGPGFEPGASHIRSPRTQGGRMQFFDRVDYYDPAGGPWKRGYLRATRAASPTDWIFSVHFKNDGCMPMTLMFEAGLQLMAFYLAACGFTLKRDGWRFEPQHDQNYRFRCRGQATSNSRELTYELFVHEVIDQPTPVLWADILCSVDGLKAFHAQRVCLRLVPDWPLVDWSRGKFSNKQKSEEIRDLRALGGLRGAPSIKAAEVDGFRFDYRSLLALAWGKPSNAFGQLYEDLDPARQLPRMPGPPFQFVSRVTRIEGKMATESLNAIEVEYDLPAEAWFFEQNNTKEMPPWLLLEIGLQPCGWLILARGSQPFRQRDLIGRNLDGKASILGDLPVGPTTLRTRIKSVGIARTKNVSIESFEIKISLVSESLQEDSPPGERPLGRIETRFGYFPKLSPDEDQIGLPVSPAEQNRFHTPSNILIDLTGAEATDTTPPYLPGPMLRMIDKIDCFIPDGGKRALGYLRARKRINPGDWFFKAHFFQDPVQPGSLGVEAFYQLLRFYLIHTGMTEETSDPQFELVEGPIDWKYRGQVTPVHSLISIELEISDRGRDKRGVFAIAEAWLWVDGKRIYHAKNIGVRVRDTPSVAVQRSGSSTEVETVIDLSSAPWLKDHRPTYSLPALPMMSVADLIASGVQKLFPNLKVIELQDLHLERWILWNDGPIRLKSSLQALDAKTLDVAVSIWREAATTTLSRFEPVARAKVLLAAEYPAAPDPMPLIPDLHPVPTPYEERRLFHGPAFQLLRQLSLSPHGSSAVLDAASAAIPVGTLSPALLDSALHGIPHDRLSFWSSEISEGFVAFPSRIMRARFYGPTPIHGTVLCNTRFTGLADPRRPSFRLELLVNQQPWAILEIGELLFPLGNLRSVSPMLREAFLTHRYAPGVSLARFMDGTTVLSDKEVQELGWMPGLLSHVYAINRKNTDFTKEIAIKDYVARSAKVHPSLVTVSDDFTSATTATQPLLTVPLSVTRQHKNVVVRSAGTFSLKFNTLLDRWLERLGVEPWVIPDLIFSLAARFIRSVVITDPAGFSNVRGRGLIFAANHQVAVESTLFNSVVSPLVQSRISILSRIENQNSWLGQIAKFFNVYPGIKESFNLILFDRQNQASLLSIVEKLERALLQGVSVLVHVEGAQALRAGHPVTKMSSVFVDLAHRTKAPILPVRFAGALPVSPVNDEIQFPIGFAKQDFYVGRPIFAEELASLPYAKRRGAVLDAINSLGESLTEEQPNPVDPEFANVVEQSIRLEGLTPEHAVLVEALGRAGYDSAQTELIKEARKTRRLVVDTSERDRWLTEFAQWLLGDIEVITR